MDRERRRGKEKGLAGEDGELDLVDDETEEEEEEEDEEEEEGEEEGWGEREFVSDVSGDEDELSDLEDAIVRPSIPLVGLVNADLYYRIDIWRRVRGRFGR